MKSQDFEFEELMIAEAIGLSRPSFDFVIGALQGAGRYRLVAAGQQTTAMAGHGFREFHKEGDPCGFRPGDPVFQEDGGCGFVGLFP
jgi:hypothetical protein